MPFQLVRRRRRRCRRSRRGRRRRRRLRYFPCENDKRNSATRETDLAKEFRFAQPLRNANGTCLAMLEPSRFPTITSNSTSHTYVSLSELDLRARSRSLSRIFIANRGNASNAGGHVVDRTTQSKPRNA